MPLEEPVARATFCNETSGHAAVSIITAGILRLWENCIRTGVLA